MEAKNVAGGGSDPNPFAVAPHAESRTPDHPPYAEMVRVALVALEERGEEEEGSTEAAISAYIVAAFAGLPPGHAALLPYYLRKLVESGFLAAPSPGRYLLVHSPPSSPQNPNPSSEPPLSAVSPRRRRRGRPPKNTASAAAAEAEAEGEAPLRRGRGRPRKRAAVAIGGEEEEEEKRKKKRGEDKHGDDIVSSPPPG